MISGIRSEERRGSFDEYTQDLWDGVTLGRRECASKMLSEGSYAESPVDDAGAATD
ncbi:MAG: hypothetical protein K0U23_08295 [Gammaproteobacteria bacterium]|nr:hypothetical protein [Gammaproteobacteria bacterium]